VEYEKISPHAIDALLITEDVRFHKHCGIDLRALIRVGFKNFILGKESAGGGSTISQQLAKLLYRRPDMTKMWAPRKFLTLVLSKLKEWITAVKLERSYTKEEIIAMYLNKFEFVNGAHGLEAASQIYFGISQDSLQISQAATLIGMLKNPSFYNPNKYPDRCKERRNTFLQLLAEGGKISMKEFNDLKDKPIDMSGFDRKDQSEGPAPYFRAELTKWLKDLLASNGFKKSDGSNYNVYTDGLKIYSTIDLNYQKHAEAAVFEHMQWNQERYWTHWKNKDPYTYQTDTDQRVYRKKILILQAKASDRYINLQKKFLGPWTEEAEKILKDAPLTDEIISKMQEIASGKITWSHLTQDQTIEIAHQERYQKLIKNELWKKITTAYNALQKAFEIEFANPTKMTIFDYSKSRRKDVVMSPMDSVIYHRKHLQAALLAVEPTSGHVKAWVGGPDHSYFKFDHCTMRRPVGSTLKPFVYTQAMAVQGISPCQEFDDIRYTISPGESGFKLNEVWSPDNSTETFTGNKYNLYHGLLYSKNSITIKLMKEMGTVNLLRDLLHNVGIDKNTRMPNGQLAVPDVPALCLGAADLTLLEMTGAYTTFANNGTYVQPIFVSRIEDKTGKVIYQATPNRKPAINPLYNAVMVDMLTNNCKGMFSMNVKSRVGGKTGTTNDFADGWFMSICPTIITGVWTGGDDKWIRFTTLDEGQGYIMARPIVELFLQKLEKDKNCDYDETIGYPTPPPGFYDLVNCAKHKTISVQEEKNIKINHKKKLEEQKLLKDDFDENEF
jgi:penicillin-binding protein 1A